MKDCIKDCEKIGKICNRETGRCNKIKKNKKTRKKQNSKQRSPKTKKNKQSKVIIESSQLQQSPTKEESIPEAVNQTLSKQTLSKQTLSKQTQSIQPSVNNMSLQKEKDKYDFLYPHKDDKDFGLKIAEKKEFNEAGYIRKTQDDYENIEKISNELCNKKTFELQQHQMFVRNFMSQQTPYNGLLL